MQARQLAWCSASAKSSPARSPAKACSIAAAEMHENETKIRKLRDNYEADSLTYPGSFVNGHKERRLYNTSNICFPGQDANMLIDRLKDVAMSNGSACSSMIVEPSHVLTAMGLREDEASQSIRISFGRENQMINASLIIR